jgi:membrane associated rhomboid family serine protease
MWLVIINVLFYAAQLILPLVTRSAESPHGIFLEQYLALTPEAILSGKIWEFLTFQVLHANPLHLILNCAMLYIFGRPMETALGRANFLKLYFGSGVAGGILQVALSYVFREHFGYFEGSWPPVVGASAGIFGLIAAFATLYRDTSITMLLAFIIPVNMKAKYLLLVEFIIAVLGLLDPNSHIAHGAHLGGMFMGIFYVRQVIHWKWRLPRIRFASRRAPRRELVSAGPFRPKVWKARREEPEEPLSPEEFVSKEVDPILDKISAHGIQSLTERERRILDAARKKMAKR